MKNKIKIAIIGSSILTALILFSLIGINLSFLFTQEFHISISPSQKIIETQNNKDFTVNYKINTNSFWFCKSTCELSIFDPYKNKTIINETSNSNLLQNFNKNFSLNLNERGAGQRLFYISASCQNKKSILCPTKSEVYKRTALLTVNYKLNDEETTILNQLKTNINSYYNITNKIINTQNALNITSNKIQSINLLANEINKLWNKEEYLTANKQLTITKILEANELKNNLTKYYNTTVDNIKKYNIALEELKQINSTKLEEIYNFFNAENNSVYKERAFTINDNKNKFLNNITDNYLQIQNLNNQYIQLTTEYQIQEQNTQNKLVKEIEKLKTFFKKFNITIQNTTLCENLNNIKNEIHKINEETLTWLNYSEFKIIAIAYQNFENITYYNESYLLGNKTIIEPNELEPEDFIKYIHISDEIINKNLLFCTTRKLNLTKTNITKPFKKIPIINSTIHYKLSNNDKECCIYQDCNSCINQPKQNPVIFIHGHSFNEKSPIEESLMSFTDMQDYFSSKGYVNAGDINYVSLDDSGLWSNMQNPLTITATYYYLFDSEVFIVRKSESIENYAIRLREIIDIVKKHTGAQKVDIVAHSMGGLVARYYIELFGNNSVGKIIEIGTPNKGIEGSIESLCGTVGASKECEEMSKNSAILSRLNSKQTNVPIYIIYGTGCDMSGSDGDGIVTKENALLKYAIKTKQITGTCSVGKYLHNKMLKNTEVFNTIINWLSD